MRWAGIIGGFVLALTGAVWIVQGLDAAFAPQSFMTNDRIWILYGSVTVVTGVLLAVWSWRRTR
jgi:hypothetical protein